VDEDASGLEVNEEIFKGVVAIVVSFFRDVWMCVAGIEVNDDMPDRLSIAAGLSLEVAV
jgi:hypothetical protein